MGRHPRFYTESLWITRCRAQMRESRAAESRDGFGCSRMMKCPGPRRSRISAVARRVAISAARVSDELGDERVKTLPLRPKPVKSVVQNRRRRRRDMDRLVRPVSGIRLPALRQLASAGRNAQLRQRFFRLRRLCRRGVASHACRAHQHKQENASQPCKSNAYPLHNPRLEPPFPAAGRKRLIPRGCRYVVCNSMASPCRIIFGCVFQDTGIIQGGGGRSFDRHQSGLNRVER